MHDAHIRMVLRNQADVICVRPIVLNPWNADALQEIEKKTGRKINTTLQLRYHPAIIALKEKVDAANSLTPDSFGEHSKYTISTSHISPHEVLVTKDLEREMLKKVEA